MTLFWLLCVSLVLGGLAHRREIRAAVHELWLQWFGVRVRVARPERPSALSPRTPRQGSLPTPQVATRVVTRAGS
jgi:hypothetical protein